MLEVDADLGLARVALDVVEQRGQHAQVVQDARAQIERERADALEQLLHQGLGLPEPLGQRGRRRLGHVEGEAQPGEELADLVVELAGQVAALRLLHLHQAPGEPLQAAVEGGVLDRDGRVVGQADQDRLVAVGEGAVGAVGDVEEALDLPADPDRDHEGGDDAFPPGRLRVVVAHPRVVGPVRGAEGPARAPRLAPRTPAAHDARRVRLAHRVAHPVAGEHRVGLGIPEQDVGDIAPAQLPGGGRHPAQDRGGIERGGDGAHQPGQRLGLDPAPLGVRVEPRVLERHRRLVREGLGEAHVVLGEDPAARIHQAERTDHLLLHGERHRQDGPDRRVLDERAHVGGELQPRVGEDVVGDDRPPLR